MKKVLVIADIPGWAFSRIYEGLKKNQKQIQFDVWFLLTENPPDFSQFDYVLNLPDSWLNHVMDLRVQNSISREQLIQAVRSEVDLPMYDSPKHLDMLCGTLLVSNQKLYDRFKDKHPNVILWQGGVDTDFFEFKERTLPEPINRIVKVGWSGSVATFDAQFRGLDIIEKAVNVFEGALVFEPALKEDKFRTMDEMKEYYNSIDIYVEMSKSAGRQNGLVEAASCGIPIISYNCGIASELIEDGVNGFILHDRDENALAHTLLNILYAKVYNAFSNNIRKTVEENWSWEKFTNDFENIILSK